MGLLGISRETAAFLALLLLMPFAAAAQTGPQVSLAREPEGPVTVGTPVRITATVLVPTFMPKPPVWPDLQVADAVTRLPERATHAVTERIGRDTWSGISRTWEITPQRPADYDLGPASIVVTYADPDTSAPVETSVPLPPLGLTATVPPGAEGLDPFVAAASLTLDASVTDLPAAPKPGDAFTLTLTITASGPPAMLLPPLAERLPTLPGLRAYPREPVLTDGDPATRTEAIAYVIEAPGHYALPALDLGWWNTATATRETATTEPVVVEVAPPPGWRSPDGGGPGSRRLLAATAAGVLAVGLGLALWLTRRPSSRPPSERSLYRALRRAIRDAPPDAIRSALAAWTAAAGIAVPAAVETALTRLERAFYGPTPEGPAGAPRSDLMHAVASARRAAPALAPRRAALPGLNAD